MISLSQERILKALYFKKGIDVTTHLRILVLLSAAFVAFNDQASAIDDVFRSLTANTRWGDVKEVPLQFKTHHPQGMIVLGDRIYLSSVQTINKAKGEGTGHLFEFNHEGRLLGQVTLGEGAMYHPGGIDFDGERLWVSVAEYRPNSKSVVYTIDPKSLKAERIFEFEDHLGAVVFDRKNERLVGVSWGSRRFYSWQMRNEDERWVPVVPNSPTTWLNGSHYIDYQDGQSIAGTSLGLFSGVKGLSRQTNRAGSYSLGGIELLDLSTGRVLHQIPIPLWSRTGRVMTQNPFYVENKEGKLRMYFIPDDDTSALYIYEPK